MNSEEILFKEYETLRAEIIAAMSNRNAILTYGLATIGILYSGAATLTATLTNSSNYSNLPTIILMLIAPIVCSFISMNWLGEYERMQRAGLFLVDIEKRINSFAKENLLTWETNLRLGKKHMKYPYHSTIIFLTLISVLSYFIGLYLFRVTDIQCILLSIIGLLLFSSFHMYLTHELRRCLN